FTIVAARPTPPPAVFRKLLRFTSLLAFEPCLSPPERVQIRTASFLNAPVLQQVFQLAHELLYILKVHVHRREAHVRHFVECFQLLHDQLADFRGGQFTLSGVMNHCFNLVDNPFQLRRGHRPLFACFQKPLQDFLPFEALPPSVLLDDHIRNFINAFVGREAAVAFQAFAAAVAGSVSTPNNFVNTSADANCAPPPTAGNCTTDPTSENAMTSMTSRKVSAPSLPPKLREPQ